MITSRVLPVLIKPNQVIKLGNVAKAQLLNSSSNFVIKFFPATHIKFEIKAMSTDVDKELTDPKRHFDYQQLIKKINQNDVILIDVREHSEIKETGKIPGSIHIPMAELEKALGEMSSEEFKNKYNADKPQKQSEVIFSCKAGGRSLKALKLSLELGYSKAANYQGGWLDWAEKSVLPN